MFNRPFFAVLLFAFLASGCGSDDPSMSQQDLQPQTQVDPWAPLARYIESRASEFGAIAPARREELDALAGFIAETADTGLVRLNFICTHNSRRSQFGQVWATVAAHHFGMDALVEAYSGGTEVTAFNERAVGALRRSGLDIHPSAISDNPKYAVHYHEVGDPLICYSKKYDDVPDLDGLGFGAIMTCSDADRGCPIVYGSTARFALPYLDPKVADGQENEREVYDERCAEVAREMLYVMSVAQGDA